MRPEALARAHLSARNYGFAESAARRAVAKQPEQVPPLAAQVEILQAVGKVKEAQEAYRKLRPAGPRRRPRPAGLPPPRRDRRGLEGRRRLVRRRARIDHRRRRADRIDLTTLGPLTWSPFAAEPFARADTDGQDVVPGRSQGQERRRPVLPRRQVCPLHAAAPGLRQGGRGPRRLDTDLVAVEHRRPRRDPRPEGQRRRRQVPDADAARPEARRCSRRTAPSTTSRASRSTAPS